MSGKPGKELGKPPRSRKRAINTGISIFLSTQHGWAAIQSQKRHKPTSEGVRGAKAKTGLDAASNASF